MKKLLSFVLASMFIASSSIVFANDSEILPSNISSPIESSIMPRLHKTNIKVTVKQLELCKIIYNRNLFKEDVTVVFESASKEIEEIYLTLEDSSGEYRQSDITLEPGDSYTFTEVPSGGYTVYATSCNETGTGYFTVSDKI